MICRMNRRKIVSHRCGPNDVSPVLNYGTSGSYNPADRMQMTYCQHEYVGEIWGPFLTCMFCRSSHGSKWIGHFHLAAPLMHHQLLKFRLLPSVHRCPHQPRNAAIRFRSRTMPQCSQSATRQHIQYSTVLSMNFQMWTFVSIVWFSSTMLHFLIGRQHQHSWRCDDVCVSSLIFHSTCHHKHLAIGRIVLHIPWFLFLIAHFHRTNRFSFATNSKLWTDILIHYFPPAKNK